MTSPNGAPRTLRSISLLVLFSLVATACQLVEGNQYRQTADDYFVSASVTSELALLVSQACDDDTDCLGGFFDTIFAPRASPDIDTGGEQLVDLISAQSAGGGLNDQFGALSPGDCLRVPKNGDPISVEPAGSDDCDAGESLAGENIVCDFSTIPTGDNGVGWELVAGAASHVVSRSTGGSFEVIHTTSEGVQFLDENPPVAATYRVQAFAASGALVGTGQCIDEAFDVGVDPDFYSPPTLPDGEVGGTGSNGLPTPIPATPPPPASALPETAGHVCTAGFLRQDLPAGGGTTKYARITVPRGTTLVMDVGNYKTETFSGNWAAEVNLYDRNDDGTLGVRRDRYGFSTPYYWNQTSYPNNNISVFTNSGNTREFLIQTNVLVSVSVSASEGAYFTAENFRFVDADGEVVGKPCELPQAASCKADGGNVFFLEPTVIDGETYQGCYFHDSCVSDLPSIVGAVSEWACENDDWLKAALVVAGATAFVLGVIVIGPGIAVAGGLNALAAAPVGFLGTGAAATISITFAGGSSTIWTIAGGAGIIGGAAAVAYGLLADENPVEYTFDAGTGTITTTAPSVTDVLADRSATVSQINNNPDLPQAQRDGLIRAIKYAVATCLASMTVGVAQRIASVVWPGQDVTDGTGFVRVVEGVTQHVCEFVPIIVSGGLSKTTLRPIAQATAHISEVLYNTAPVATEQHTGLQPDLPRTEWFFLDRRVGGRTEWYTANAYGCSVQNVGNDCDEWPWAATNQYGPAAGDKAQAHLRIISSSHNRVSGRELQTFYGSGIGCGVGDGELFMAVPVPAELMLANAGPLSGLPIPTQFVCPAL